MVATILRFPFTRGAVVLVAATAVGAIPYGGILTLLLATTFALPVVRASARGGPDGDRMPRLVPPPPGLGGELLLGALLQLFYFGPFLLVVAFAFLADDVPELGFLSGLMALPLLVQLVMVVLWPAAVALLATGAHPFTAATRRVFGQAEEMGSGYAIVVAWLILAGGALLCGAGQIREQGLIGRLGASALVAWFWLVSLHLIGRALRSHPRFAEPSAPG